MSKIASVPIGKIEVPEIKITESIKLSAKETAMIVVDMQNDFVAPDGAMSVPAAMDTVPKIKDLLQRAREAEVHVVYSQDTHLPESPEHDIWTPHVMKDSTGWEIYKDLKPQPNEIVFQKPRYDAFYGTSLDHYLTKLWNVKNLIVVGTVSNICVMHTMASAGLRWLHVICPADCISALSEFEQALTLHQTSTLFQGDIVRAYTDITFE